MWRCTAATSTRRSDCRRTRSEHSATNSCCGMRPTMKTPSCRLPWRACRPRTALPSTATTGGWTCWPPTPAARSSRITRTCGPGSATGCSSRRPWGTTGSTICARSALTPITRFRCRRSWRSCGTATRARPTPRMRPAGPICASSAPTRPSACTSSRSTPSSPPKCPASPGRAAAPPCTACSSRSPTPCAASASPTPATRARTARGSSTPTASLLPLQGALHPVRRAGRLPGLRPAGPRLLA